MASKVKPEQKQFVPTRANLPKGGSKSKVLNKSIVAWDGGNGMSSAWIADGKSLRYASIPNVRVTVTGYQLGKDVSGFTANDLTWMEAFGHRYGIGDHVWEAAVYPPETFTNTAERYGSEMHVFMLLSLLAILGAPEDEELSIVTSAPPALIGEVSETVKSVLLGGQNEDGSGVWQIKPSWDKRKKPRTYCIERVAVLPEGMGAVGAYSFDLKGDMVFVEDHQGEDYLGGLVAIHDAGYGTWDNYTLQNGKLNQESMTLATDPTAGILQHMIEPVRDRIRTEFLSAGMQAPTVHAPQVDSWLREWKMTGNARVQLGGLVLELGDFFEQTTFKYAQYIFQEKLEPTWQQEAKAIVATGGGWEYILDDILEWSHDRRILYPGLAKHLRGIPLWELHTYGMLVITASQLAKRTKDR